jgi:hypothetical protein
MRHILGWRMMDVGWACCSPMTASMGREFAERFRIVFLPFFIATSLELNSSAQGQLRAKHARHLIE